MRYSRADSSFGQCGIIGPFLFAAACKILFVWNGERVVQTAGGRAVFFMRTVVIDSDLESQRETYPIVNSEVV
jgi:hypothetical protein